MQLDEVPHDSEAEAQTAELPRRAAVALAETLEQMDRNLRVETDAGVADGQADVGAVAGQRDANVAAGGCELDRVRDEIPDDLLKPIRIDGDGRERRVEIRRDVNSLRLGSRLQSMERRVHERLEPRGYRGQLELAGDDARDVEQVFDEARLRPSGALDRLNRALRLDVVQLAAGEQPRPTEHGVERRAQFVGKRGKEIVLQPVGGLGLFRRLVRPPEQRFVIARQAVELATYPPGDGCDRSKRGCRDDDGGHDRPDVLDLPHEDGGEDADGSQRYADQTSQLWLELERHTSACANSWPRLRAVRVERDAVPNGSDWRNS